MEYKNLANLMYEIKAECDAILGSIAKLNAGQVKGVTILESIDLLEVLAVQARPIYRDDE